MVLTWTVAEVCPTRVVRVGNALAMQDSKSYQGILAAKDLCWEWIPVRATPNVLCITALVSAGNAFVTPVTDLPQTEGRASRSLWELPTAVQTQNVASCRTANVQSVPVPAFVFVNPGTYLQAGTPSVMSTLWAALARLMLSVQVSLMENVLEENVPVKPALRQIRLRPRVRGGSLESVRAVEMAIVQMLSITVFASVVSVNVIQVTSSSTRERSVGPSKWVSTTNDLHGMYFIIMMCH